MEYKCRWNFFKKIPYTFCMMDRQAYKYCKFKTRSENKKKLKVIFIKPEAK